MCEHSVHCMQVRRSVSDNTCPPSRMYTKRGRLAVDDLTYNCFKRLEADEFRVISENERASVTATLLLAPRAHRSMAPNAFMIPTQTIAAKAYTARTLTASRRAIQRCRRSFKPSLTIPRKTYPRSSTRFAHVRAWMMSPSVLLPKRMGSMSTTTMKRMPQAA